MTKFYQCNPELFKKCKKIHCQKECTLTTIKEYAKTDEFGNPIIALVDNLNNKESEEGETEARDRKAKIKAKEILKNDIEVCTHEQQEAVDMAVAALDSEVGDTIPREKLETAKKMIRARFMDSGETVMQNETRRAVCREFIKILEEVCG